jgi:hypothetical protein
MESPKDVKEMTESELKQELIKSKHRYQNQKQVKKSKRHLIKYIDAMIKLYK